MPPRRGDWRHITAADSMVPEENQVPWEVIDSQVAELANLITAVSDHEQEVRREVTVEFSESSRRVQERAVERPSGYWKLRNGKFIAMSEMDDEHLNNCIRMCERNQQARGRRADPTAPGAYGELIHERTRRAARLAEHAEAIRTLDNYLNSNWTTQFPSEQAASSERIWGVRSSNEGALNSGLTSTPQGMAIEPESLVPEQIGPPKGAPKRRIKT